MKTTVNYVQLLTLSHLVSYLYDLYNLKYNVVVHCLSAVIKRAF